MGTRVGVMQRKRLLIDFAMQQYEEIFPCANREKLDDCFTDDEGRLFFWFNTRDESTHVLSVAKRGRQPSVLASMGCNSRSKGAKRQTLSTARCRMNTSAAVSAGEAASRRKTH